MTRTRQTVHTRRTLALTPADWAVIDALAVDLGAYATRGAGASDGTQTPAWSALIRMIARGELVVSRPIVKSSEIPEIGA